MNKSLAGILGVTVALTLLAGCTAYDRTKDQFTQPGRSPSFCAWVACRTIATCHSGWLSNSPTDRPSSPGAGGH